MKLLSQAGELLSRALRYDGSPRQLALGVALGVAIGLMPKANLVTLALVIGLFSLRINIASGLFAALCTSAVAFIADPILHHMGTQLLAVPSMQDIYASLATSRWAPWTSFNNTVVMGAMFVGACQLVPTYFVFKSYFEKHRPTWAVDSDSAAIHGDTVATSWSVG